MREIEQTEGVRDKIYLTWPSLILNLSKLIFTKGYISFFFNLLYDYTDRVS